MTEHTEERCATLATGCAGTRCNNLPSDGYDTCFICRRMLDAEQLVERLTAERDRARDLAVALEQELAKVARIIEEAVYAHDALMDIHRVVSSADVLDGDNESAVP